MSVKLRFFAPALRLLGAVMLAVVFASICYSPQTFDERIVRLHQDLMSLEARGQSAIELFAPFSRLFRETPPSWLLVLSKASILWPILGLVWLELLPVTKSFSRAYTIPITLVFLAVVRFAEVEAPQEGALQKVAACHTKEDLVLTSR